MLHSSIFTEQWQTLASQRISQPTKQSCSDNTNLIQNLAENKRFKSLEKWMLINMSKRRKEVAKLYNLSSVKDKVAR